MSYTEFVVLMALVTSMIALAIDAVLPALPAIGAAFAVADPNQAQWVIGALFLGLAVSQLAFGPLSDSLGRKPVILIGTALFALGCLVSALATDFTWMLVGRVLQGLGAGGPRTATIAMIRDKFEGRAMARTMSLVTTVFIVVPVFAPALGQTVLLIAPWRAMFWLFLAVAAVMSAWVWLRLEETLAAAHRRRLDAGSMWMAARAVTGNRLTLGYLLVGGFVFSAFIGYLTSAQQVMAELYGLGDWFPVAFGVLACGIGAANLVNAALVMRLGMRRLTLAALLLAFGLAAGLFAAALVWGGKPPALLVGCLMLPMFCAVGMTFGNVNALAMQPMGHVAGMAAALIGAGATAISTVFGSLIGQAYDGSLRPLAFGFVAFFALALLARAWAESGRADDAAVAGPDMA